jgi:hypothetical protein
VGEAWRVLSASSWAVNERHGRGIYELIDNFAKKVKNGLNSGTFQLNRFKTCHQKEEGMAIFSKQYDERIWKLSLFERA